MKQELRKTQHVIIIHSGSFTFLSETAFVGRLAVEIIESEASQKGKIMRTMEGALLGKRPQRK